MSYDNKRAKKAVADLSRDIKTIALNFAENEPYICTEMAVNKYLLEMVEMFLTNLAESVAMAHEANVHFDL